MASPSTPVHPARYLAVFLVLLVGVYLLVFLTGDKQARPKLGIDLQGGTRVTLTARTPDGSAPTRDALNQAQQIISARVNGLGVSGSEVIIDGSNLVITVPGNDSSEARNLGQTARLYIRPVIEVYPAAPPQQGQAGQPPAGAPSPRPRYRRGRHRARLRRRKEHRPPSPQQSREPPRRSRLSRLRRSRARTRRLRHRLRHRRSPTRRRISLSASPTRRSGGRAPRARSSTWHCRSRPPSATRTTSSQATTIRICRW